MFFLHAIAFITLLLPLLALLKIVVPGRSGLKVFNTLTGMFLFIAGSMDFGCSTLAPKYANSEASANEILPMVFALLAILGSVVNMPSTSVHICISSAFIALPIIA